MGRGSIRSAWSLILLGALAHIACSTSDGAPTDSEGSGGASPGASGGALGSGGTTSSGGQSGSGGASGGVPGGGGAPASGGSASGSGGEVGSGGEGGTGGGGTGGAALVGLSWPIDCIPDSTCVNLDYPDTDDDGVAHDCGAPGYQGHQGTDIGVTWEQMDAGVAVRAAADGTVFFAADGKYDRCPEESEPDCQNPPSYVAGSTEGTTVCTELGPYCHPPGGSCFWCFAGGNVIVVLHDTVEGVFATRYDHLKNGSVRVAVGDTVARGEQIAEVGSAGNSTGPHLHFEVWAEGYYDLADPWVGACGPNMEASLWALDPPWSD